MIVSYHNCNCFCVAMGKRPASKPVCTATKAKAKPKPKTAPSPKATAMATTATPKSKAKAKPKAKPEPKAKAPRAPVKRLIVPEGHNIPKRQRIVNIFDTHTHRTLNWTMGEEYDQQQGLEPTTTNTEAEASPTAAAVSPASQLQPPPGFRDIRQFVRHSVHSAQCEPEQTHEYADNSNHESHVSHGAYDQSAPALPAIQDWQEFEASSHAPREASDQSDQKDCHDEQGGHEGRDQSQHIHETEIDNEDNEDQESHHSLSRALSELVDAELRDDVEYLDSVHTTSHEERARETGEDHPASERDTAATEAGNTHTNTSSDSATATTATSAAAAAAAENPPPMIASPKRKDKSTQAPPIESQPSPDGENIENVGDHCGSDGPDVDIDSISVSLKAQPHDQHHTSEAADESMDYDEAMIRNRRTSQLLNLFSWPRKDLEILQNATFPHSPGSTTADVAATATTQEVDEFLHHLHMVIKNTKISTAFSGIDTPATSIGCIDVELRTKLTLDMSSIGSDFKAHNLFAIEKDSQCQNHLIAHPLGPQCVFGDMESFWFDAIRHKIPHLVQTKRLLPVIKDLVQRRTPCVSKTAFCHKHGRHCTATQK